MTAQLGAQTMKAAALVAADADHTAIEVGTASFAIRMPWTACEIASNDELYVVKLKANTRAADTTWVEIGTIFVGGATEVTGGSGDTAATGEVWAGFRNPYDYQVRASTYVNGTIATGINFGLELYPIEALGYV